MANITKNASLVSLASTFTRTNGQPIDDSILFSSLTEAQNYAKTARAYVGQIISVVENNVVTIYVISDVSGTLSNLADDSITRTYVDNEIKKLDVNTISFDPFEGMASIKETDGKISVIKQDIQISKGQVNELEETLTSIDNSINNINNTLTTLQNVLHFLGVKTSTESVSDPQHGDVIIVGYKEYVYDTDEWVEFGDLSALPEIEETLTDIKGRVKDLEDVEGVESIPQASLEALFN